MPARVIVVAGPARCGKTERLLAGYRQALRSGGVGGTLWIAPTHRSAAEVRGRLLAAELRACFSPAVMTFAQFAEQVLAASGQVVQPITELVKRHLIRRLIRAANEAGRLQHFGPIATTTGLVDLVAEFIGELKRSEIWPESFDAACVKRGSQNKDRELSSIYRAYQDHLNAHQLYDAEGRFWTTRELLKAGQTRPFEAVRYVVVDGFTDFTHTQHEILEILARRVDELRVALPIEAEAGRPDLFAKPAQTLKILEHNLHGVHVERISRPQPPRWPALAHVEAELFKNPRNVRPSTASEGIEIIEAARASDELYLVVRRIKELLARGDRESGQPVRPGDVAIVLRSPASSRAVLEEAFRDLGVPYALDAGRQLAQAPVIAATTALLRLHAEDWPFRAVLAVLGNNYFQPDWPVWQNGLVASAVHTTIRGLQIVRGRDALLAALRRAAAEPAAEPAAAPAGEPAPSREAPRQALGVAERLADALGRLPSRASPSAWAKALASLAAETGLSRAISAQDDTAADVDRAAWDTLIESLIVAERFSTSAGPSEHLGSDELLDLIGDLSRTETLPATHDEIGRVRVLSATSVRALSIPYLFFAGLSEKAFPPAERSDRLYSEAEYERLAAAGLPLVLRAEHNQEEMLLFYEVLTRAERRLYLSYPGLDEKGQPLLPSPYLAEMETMFAGQVARFRVEDLSPIPRDGHAAGPVEQRILGVAQAVGVRQPGAVGGLQSAPPAKPRSRAKQASAETQKRLLFAAGDTNLDLLTSLAGQSETLPVFDNIVAGLAATASRGERETFGPFEGMLAGDAVRQRLTARYGPTERWSASRLEAFRACPFQFFLAHILELSAAEELTLDTDYLERGSALHDILARLHREMNDLLARPTSAADPAVAERFRASLAELLDERARGDDRRQPFLAALAEVDRRVLHAWLTEYVDQHARYDAQWTKLERPLAPAHFEISFGEERPGGDPLSTTTPLKISDGQRELMVRGRIDRLDLGQVGGVPVFNVLDYKSGKSGRHTRHAVESGDDLQVFLYTLAAAEILAAGHQPLVAGYWFVADNGFPSKPPLCAHQHGDDGLQPTDEWLALREANVKLIMALVDAIRAGQFPVASRNEQCTSFCDFRTVCRVNQVRALEKTWEPVSPQPKA